MALFGSMYSGWSRANSRVASQSVSTVRKYSYWQSKSVRKAFLTLSNCLRVAHEDYREAVDFVVRFHLPGCAGVSNRPFAELALHPPLTKRKGS